MSLKTTAKPTENDLWLGAAGRYSLMNGDCILKNTNGTQHKMRQAENTLIDQIAPEITAVSTKKQPQKGYTSFGNTSIAKPLKRTLQMKHSIKYKQIVLFNP